MLRILLYFSVFLASFVTYGEGVAPVDETQLEQQLGVCEPSDGQAVEYDDQIDPAITESSKIRETSGSIISRDPVLLSSNSPSTSYSIRAPPIFS